MKLKYPAANKHVLFWQYIVVLFHLGLWRSDHELITYLFADAENWPFVVWFIILSLYAVISYWLSMKHRTVKTVDNYVTVGSLLFISTILGIAQVNYMEAQPNMDLLDLVTLFYIIGQTLLFVFFIKRPPKTVERIEMNLSYEGKAAIIGGAAVLSAILFAAVDAHPIQLTITMLAVGTGVLQYWAKKNPITKN